MFKKQFSFASGLNSDLIVDHRIQNSCIPSVNSFYNGGWFLNEASRCDYGNSYISTDWGIYVNSDKSENYALTSKIKVSSWGLYKVTVRIYAQDTVEGMNLYTNLRAFVDYDCKLEKGSEYIKSFYVNVTPYIIAHTNSMQEEKIIFVSVTGKNAGLSEITVEQVESTDIDKLCTIWVAGDSTLTDQSAISPYNQKFSCGGWAQMLSLYVKDAAVCNLAHSGMTTTCFREDGHYKIIQDNIRKGDFVIIQFGHNDQKRRYLSPFTGYLTNLKRYVDEITSYGAYPVIVSPISRIPLKDGKETYSLLSGYELACSYLADTMNIQFINLHKKSFEYWNSCADPHDFFVRGDVTHTNDTGALLLASMFVHEVMAQKQTPLSSYMQENSSYEVKECCSNSPAPEIREGSIFDIPLPYLDIKDSEYLDSVTKAFRRGLLDPCILYIHPEKYLSRAEFLMVLCKAINIAPVHPYSGWFYDMDKIEWYSGFVEVCLQNNLIDSRTVNQRMFRPDENLLYRDLCVFTVRALSDKNSRKDLNEIYCINKAIELGIIPNNVNPDKAVVRGGIYQSLVVLMDNLSFLPNKTALAIENHPVL